MIRAMLRQIVVPVAMVAMASGALIATVTASYCCGYLQAWDELQAAPPVVQLDEPVLTEAIEFCRALSAEFPDDTHYKDRLAALTQLQARHVGNRAKETKP